MDKLKWWLQNLPVEGKRLDGGLALRLRTGSDFAYLECSRVDKPPSEVEMRTVVAAVAEAFQPPIIWRGRVFVGEHGGYTHHGYRLYWPVAPLETMYTAPAEQRSLRLVPAGGKFRF